MLVNADFSQFSAIRPDQRKWIASPQIGVERVMLDRVGTEVARATSLVRYACHSVFREHSHPLGEEFLVLDGTFSDETANFPAGWYVRNPPGSSHRPSSRVGALIFVKLMQMNRREGKAIRINTGDPRVWTKQSCLEVCELFDDASERVRLIRAPAAAQLLQPPHVGGAEMLVLDGLIANGDQRYPLGTWIRLPPDATHVFHAGPSGAKIYLKTGHLRAPMSPLVHIGPNPISAG